MTVNVDRNFPERVTNSSLVLGLVLFLFLYGIQLENWAFGFGVGATLSIFSFEVLRVAFNMFLRTPTEKEKRDIKIWEKITIGLLLLLKLPIWIAVLYLSIQFSGYNLIAILLGIGITQFVMVLKVVSLWLTGEKKNKTDQKSNPELSIEASQSANQ